MVNWIEDEVKAARAKFTKDAAERDYLQSQLDESLKLLGEFEEAEFSLTKVRALFQEAATITQQKIEYHISNIVSTALAAIWDDPYEFELEFVSRRGKTEADLWFVREGNKMHPMDSSGGGPIDIASMALRIAAWSLNKNTRPIIIVDEPFKNLSNNLQGRAYDMLKMLSEKLGLQIIMVSHIDELINNADKQIEIKRDNGISKVVS